jgi:hypothetical protein
MSRRLVFVIAAGLALSGCCLGSGRYIQPPSLTPTSWDGGLAPLPKHKSVKRTKVRMTNKETASDDDSRDEAELAALKPYSKEWWSARDVIDRAAEVKLAKKLIICRDCLPKQSDDQTGSIAPK